MRRRRLNKRRLSKANVPAAADQSAPLGVDEFARLMAGLGPFEQNPVLAVGVSGGPDSMVLCALADDWSRRRGVRILALTVDHRLRADSGDEAGKVAVWLGDRGVDHLLLTRRGPDIHAGVHAAARTARYDLMGAACRDRGILHLLLAHHRNDQAETFLLRLSRSSGLNGLAAMAAVVEGRSPRLLRPLLSIPTDRLRATLAARGLPSVDDPSNRNPAYGRTRIRRLAPILAAAGVTAARLARTATALGRARSHMEGAVADFLAAAVTIHGAGFCRLDREIYRHAPGEIARQALARILLCIGSGAYGPRSDRLQRLHGALAGDVFNAGRTLGDCRILPYRRGVLICRETRAVAGPAVLEAGGSVLWDRRFLLQASAGDNPFEIRRLDRAVWSSLPVEDRKAYGRRLPGAVRSSLPVVCDLDGIVAVPHLSYVRGGQTRTVTVDFRPAQGLSPAVFAFCRAAG